MHIHELKRKHPAKKKRQIGRGGKRGKTAGRGTKGQSSRAGGKLRPELRDIIKKLPKKRGFGKNRAKSVIGSRVTVGVANVGALEKAFTSGDTVTREALVEKKIIRRVSGKIPTIKILGSGTLTKKLTIKGLTISGSAKEKVEKAGGTIAA